MKKYFLISDPHGNYEALSTSLMLAGFDKNNESHWLVSVGDLFDRGLQSEAVYKYVKDIKNKITILGNHDEMLLDFLSGLTKDYEWNCKHNGFWETLQSLADLPKSDTWHNWIERKYELIHLINERHPDLLDFLKDMVNVVMIENNLITHGGFKRDPFSGEWIVNNFANTEIFIQQTLGSFPQFNFIFGHWHAFRLNEKFYKKEFLFEKFIYENYVGIDACSNFIPQVFVHIIESDQEPKTFCGQVRLEILANLDNLEDF